MAKAAGLYMICTISQAQGEREGYADAMMLDWQDRVAECTGATSSSSRTATSILRSPTASPGITRHPSTRPPARHRGDRAAASCRNELSSFTECFITGTAAESRRCRRSRSGSHPRRDLEQLMADYTAEVQPKARPRRRKPNAPLGLLSRAGEAGVGKPQAPGPRPPTPTLPREKPGEGEASMVAASRLR